jgi:hypothetical protein
MILVSLNKTIQLIKLQKDTQEINKSAIPHKYTFGKK